MDETSGIQIYTLPVHASCRQEPIMFRLDAVAAFVPLFRNSHPEAVKGGEIVLHGGYAFGVFSPEFENARNAWEKWAERCSVVRTQQPSDLQTIAPKSTNI